jgi:hypothetical protein
VPANDTGPAPGNGAGAGPALSPEAELACRLLRAWESRGDAFGADLFGDPAWGILLELFAAGERGEPLTSFSICGAAGTPSETASRWVLALEKRGHVMRTGDRGDGGRMHFTLTADTAQKMRTLLRSWL